MYTCHSCIVISFVGAKTDWATCRVLIGHYIIGQLLCFLDEISALTFSTHGPLLHLKRGRSNPPYQTSKSESEFLEPH